MIKAVVISEIPSGLFPELEIHCLEDGSVGAERVLCQMTLLMADGAVEDTHSLVGGQGGGVLHCKFRLLG